MMQSFKPVLQVVRMPCEINLRVACMPIIKVHAIQIQAAIQNGAIGTIVAKIVAVWLHDSERDILTLQVIL